jgi:glycosyl-4,4'-diaponeurosporenoate acyltransferase
VFAGGFNKAALAGLSGGYLEAYVRETRRAELGHWLAMGLSPVFFLWNPWYVAAGLVACALAGNGPCVASQRYNRLRLQRVLAKRAARQRNTVER